MHPCPSCARPLIHAESVCPFCAAPQTAPGRTLASSIGRGFMAVVTPLVLAACYGSPSGETYKLEDEDGDGYSVEEDCDDDNAEISPDATELCDDGIDNNCDGVVDSDDTSACP